ncbi:MAG: class I SAM-dependent methyltransferase [Proteobacteria bacterium]|nr:class I SAM-dependent methyltransferase [Pseudomonadota bacterium]
MLSSIFITQTVNAVCEALESAGIDSGAITVLEQPRIGRALASRGHQVVQVADKARSLRRILGDRMCSEPDVLPLADNRIDAVVAPGVGQRDDWNKLLSEWSRVVREGGVIVMVDRAQPTELTRRALCSGLAEIGQRQVGRTIVTSGLVKKIV